MRDVNNLARINMCWFFSYIIFLNYGMGNIPEFCTYLYDKLNKSMSFWRREGGGEGSKYYCL